MPRHLLSEAALERQVPLDEGDTEWDLGEDVGSEGSAEGEFLPGDSVQLPNLCPGVTALVVDDDEALVLREDQASREGVVVWMCVPTFCGPPECLFCVVDPEDLELVERPIDGNTLVHEVSESNSYDSATAPRQGQVERVSITFAAFRLKEVLEYHTRNRYSKHQLALCRTLTAMIPRHPRDVKRHDKKRFMEIAHHWSSLTMCEVTGSGSEFVRCQPYRLGQFVKSRTRVSMDTEAENGDQYFFGHVRSVDFAALVELFLPPLPKEDSNDTPLTFVVLIPPSVIATTTCRGADERMVVVNNIRNRTRLGARSDDDVSDAVSSVAPQHLDALAPLMLVEYISLDALRDDSVLWVAGQYEDFVSELQRRQRGRHERRKRKELDVSQLCANGIVVFAFPVKVTAVSLDDGTPREFNAEDLLATETNGADNVMAGQLGFLAPTDLVFPQSVASAPTQLSIPCSDALNAWYTAHGIIGSNPQESWMERIAKLQSVMENFVVVTRTRSDVFVALDDGTKVTFESKCLRRRERVAESDMHTNFVVAAEDVVRPSAFYLQNKLSTTVERLKASFSACASLLVDTECSTLDILPICEPDTELQISESVRPRLNRETFIVDDTPLAEDPPVLGMVHSVNVTERTCVIEWFWQPAEEEVVDRRPDDVGQIVALLSNTLVRVLWCDGTLEDVPRAQLIPCRDFDEQDEENDDWDESNWSEESDEEHAAPIGTQENSTSPQQTPVVNAGYGMSPAKDLMFAVGRFALRFLVGFARLTRAASQLIGQPRPCGSDASPAPLTCSDIVASTPESEVELPETTRPARLAPGVSFEEVSPNARSFCEMVSMFSSHSFADDDHPPHNPKLFMKRLQYEWREMSLFVDELNAIAPQVGPTASRVYVKTCSAAPRLLKFALVGPLHTPYYQSLLMFDALFPADYPIGPPHISFHANQLRLNPNLYEDGHICLSLLGTWEGGDSSESWSPATSSMKQVILSILSLVLVKEPYYNEAGYENRRGQASARAASKAYNEQLALLRLQHLIATAKHPPPDWVLFSRQHFRSFAPALWQRLTDLIDAPSAGEGVTADGLVLPLTRGFTLALRSALQSLKACIDTLIPEWDAEEQRVALEHLRDE